MWAMGITQHIVGVRNVMDLANLQMLLGNLGVPGGGVNPLRGQNNVQGACDMGALPNVYPGYQPVTVEDAQKKFEAAWGVPLSNKVGLTVTEMMPGILEGKIHALYILGEDPVMSDPNSAHIRECPYPKILNNNINLRNQLHDDFFSFRVSQVDGQASFVKVNRHEGNAVNHRLGGYPRKVSLQGFHFNDIGPEIREQTGANRGKRCLSKIEHFNSVQGLRDPSPWVPSPLFFSRTSEP